MEYEVRSMYESIHHLFIDPQGKKLERVPSEYSEKKDHTQRMFTVFCHKISNYSLSPRMNMIFSRENFFPLIQILGEGISSSPSKNPV